jgi:hypothetical protein
MNGNGNADGNAGGSASLFPGCRCGLGLGRRGSGGRGFRAGLSLGRAELGPGQGAEPTAREIPAVSEGKAAPLPENPAIEEIGVPFGRFGRGRCGRGRPGCGRGLGLRGVGPLPEEPAGGNPGGADPAPGRNPA